MWTTWPQTRPRRASFAHVPTFAQVHEAIKQQNSVSLQNIDARYIDIYLYSKEARSPRLSFLLDPSLASDSGRLEHGNASKTNRKSCARTPAEPNPRLRDRPFELPRDGITARHDCYGFLPWRPT